MRFHWSGFDSLERLSAEETAELAARVADLTRAGLPLSDGLRALSGELAGRRLRRVLVALADQLDAGVDLAVAVDSQSGRLPTCLRGLILAGLRSGRLAETLEEYVDLQRTQSDLRRRLWLSLSYPLLLLVFLTFLALVAKLYVVDHFVVMYKEYGINLPAMTKIYISNSWSGLYGLLVLLCMCAGVPALLGVAPAVRWVWPVLNHVPMVGPLLRWTHLSQFARLMAVLLDQGVPLPDALRLVAAGLRDCDLAYACRRVADDVDNGRVLYDSMASRGQFPPSMIPMIEWGQRNAALGDAFRAAVEMFEGRVRSQGSVLDAIVLPMVFLIIGAYIAGFVMSLLLPLFGVFTFLSC
ncbi:MAG: type II secretion system F family protein [Planctomycetaceae bacterium]|nr:type II secretion system F family protein [Planctomycetaceae bacterium]